MNLDFLMEPKARKPGEADPADVARAVVRDLREEIGHGLNAERVLTGLDPSELAVIQRFTKTAHQARTAKRKLRLAEDACL